MIREGESPAYLAAKCKVLSLLIVNLVERLRRPVTFLNHFHAIGVLFDGSGLGDVLRFHKEDKIIRQRVCQ